MQTTAVIIDDEQQSLNNLAFSLHENCPQVTIVATATNADDGKKIILEHNPNIVFLDIQMPDKDGFDLLSSLSNYSFEVIFVTGYDQYGIEAIKFSAIDYLLKPVRRDELKKAVEKATVKTLEKRRNLQLENLMQILEQQQNKEKHRIALPAIKETSYIPVSEIIRCESANSYTMFYLLSTEKIIVTKPIYEYERILDDYGFIRCHKSHLVNKKFIKKWISEDGGCLVLRDATKVPVSRAKKEDLKQQLGDII